MGRPRSNARRNWPDNLQGRTVRGVLYYSYRNPETGIETSLGSDLDAAIEAVRLVNRKRTPNRVQSLLTRIENPTSTVGQHAQWYDSNVLQQRKLADSTRYIRRLALGLIRRELGDDTSIAGVDRLKLSAILEQLTPQSANNHRALMLDFFRHAISRGLRENNPAEFTVKRDFQVNRRRLTKKQFDQIRDGADPWFQRAMDLALWSLQRRHDLVMMAATHWKGGELRVRQSKVERHGTGLLMIRPGPKLKSAIIACLNSDERGDCPYLLHRIPEKKIEAEWRTHPLQIAPETLTREFSRLRDELPEFKKMPEAQRPTFHEIRALGGDSYRKAGWPDEKIQALFGHSNRDISKMTQHYLDGHGERWVKCDAA